MRGLGGRVNIFFRGRNVHQALFLSLFPAGFMRHLGTVEPQNSPPNEVAGICMCVHVCMYACLMFVCPSPPLNLRAACLQNETAPEKLLNRDENHPIAKGAGGKGPRQKSSKSVNKFFNTFRQFSRRAKNFKNRQKSQKVFRHFSRGTFFPAPFGGL